MPMANFLLGRLLQSLVLLFIVSIIGFAVLHLAPGGPLSQFALVPGLSKEDLARIAHEMGLDRPLPVQYWEWLTRLLGGDWGHSYRDNQPVLAVIGGRLSAPLEFVGGAILISVGVGVWGGVWSALLRCSIFGLVG